MDYRWALPPPPPTSLLAGPAEKSLIIRIREDFSLDTGLKVELNDLLEETPGHKVAPPGESPSEGSAILSDLPLGRDVSADRLEPISVKKVIENI
jgi:hypothetical protein